MTTLTAQQVEPAAQAVLEVLPIFGGTSREAVLVDLDGGAREVLAAAVRGFAARTAAAAGACGDLLADTDGAEWFADKAEAMAWYRRNLPVVPAVVAAAAALGLDDLAWRIVADAEQGYSTDLLLPAWQQVLAAGWAATQRLPDAVGAGRVLLSSGTMHRFAGRTRHAITDLTAALEAFERVGEPRGRRMALNRLALACLDARELDRALELFAEVTAMSLGQDGHLQALAVMNMAEAHHRRGDHVQAVSFARRALEMLHACDAAERRITQGHLHLARALVGFGDLEEAGQHVQRVLEDTAGWGDYASVALAAHMVDGEWHLACGRYDRALEAFERAVAMRLGPYLQADIQEGLGRALAGRQRIGDAVVLYELALANRQAAGVPFDIARTLSFLAEAQAGTDRRDACREAAMQALDLLAGIADPAAEELRGRLAALAQ